MGVGHVSFLSSDISFQRAASLSAERFQRLNLFLRIFSSKDGTSGNENVGPCFNQFLASLSVDAAVDFDEGF